jgi:phosphopantothenoylcysteine decarboxylase/phosphopantothenate--cysteine ligase
MGSKCIVLGVTGGVAAYKAVDLARKLTRSGYRVKTIMTEHATRLVTPLTFESVTGEEVATSLFREGGQPMYHISLAQEARLVIVAPATANILAKMAAGIADDLLSTTLLATRAPVLVAPAMNTSMYLHPATRHNLSVLAERGIKVIGPDAGSLACGEEGEGRMVEPDEILEAVRREMGERESLRGVKVVVTAGGTREPLDAVRFLGNRSSGKMGFALAEAARCEGAEVVLVSGPTWLEPPPGVSIRMVETAREMYECVLAEAEDAEVIIKAAAVADFTPAKPQAGKVKKEEAELTLELQRTHDILAELGARKRPGQILVGFSAETDQVRKNALAKLRRKNLDLMVANDVSRSDAGFDVDSNQAVIIAADGEEQELPLMSKADLARIVVERVVKLKG